MALILNTQTDEQYVEVIKHDANYIDCDGSPALCKVIYKFRNLALVDKLLKNGANVNAFTTISRPVRDTETIEYWNKWGQFSAIHIAVGLREIDIVKLLLANGADPNALTRDGYHPLFIILGKHRQENETAAELESKELEILKLLHKHNSDIKVRNNDEQTLLHDAIYQRKYDIAECLIENGCDPNDIDKYGRTPLHYIYDDLKCAEVLLKNNADPNIQDCDGRTVCHRMVTWAMRHICPTVSPTFLDTIRLLLDHHLDLNVTDNNGKTVLHLCLKYLTKLKNRAEGVELCKLFLENGADPNVADEFGWTPLFHLIGYGDLWEEIKIAELMRHFVQYGVNFDKRDLIGQPLLHVLMNRCLNHIQDMVCMKSIIKCFPSDTNFNIEDFLKRTTLHLVAAHGNWELGRFLLENGADKNALDCDGNSPLHVAIENKQWEFAKRLLIGGEGERGIGLTEWNQWQLRPIRRSQSMIDNKDNRFIVRSRHDSHYTARALKNPALKKYFAAYSVIVFTGAGIKKKRPERTPSFDSTPQEIPKELAQSISSASLADLCEEKSMGDIHLSGTCGKEKCEVSKQVHRFVNDLVKKCAQLDERFESKLIWTGSTAEGTKMWAPDEFDFMTELTKLEDQCQIERDVLGEWPSVIVRNEISQKLWSDLLDNKECCTLMPDKLLEHFSRLLWVAAQCLDRTNYKHISFNLAQYDTRPKEQMKGHFIRQTNVGAMLTVYWLGTTYKYLEINIDIAPAIPLKMPQKDKARLRQHTLYNEQDMSCCHVIPYISLKNSYDGYWRLSFALLELDLMRKHMTSKQVCLYKCLKLFRDIFENKNAMPAVPSYVLKCFCFDLFFGDKWKRLEELDQFNECVHEVLVILKEYCYPGSMENNTVENYFIALQHHSFSLYDMAWCHTLEEYLSSTQLELLQSK